MADVTYILEKIDAGDTAAAKDLLPLVYEELRRLASIQLKDEASQITLQPTALVHEAYLRLVDQPTEQKWSHRGHFYASAAEAMRRILVERARRRRTLKGGRNWERVPVDPDHVASKSKHPDIIALDNALAELSSRRPEIARLVSLRYFAGLDMEQAAKSLGISPRTAARNWTYAKAWLKEALERDQPRP